MYYCSTIQYNFTVPVGWFFWQQYEHCEPSNVTYKYDILETLYQIKQKSPLEKSTSRLKYAKKSQWLFCGVLLRCATYCNTIWLLSVNYLHRRTDTYGQTTILQCHFLSAGILWTDTLTFGARSLAEFGKKKRFIAFSPCCSKKMGWGGGTAPSLIFLLFFFSSFFFFFFFWRGGG